jgi:hypothetical protein
MCGKSVFCKYFCAMYRRWSRRLTLGIVCTFAAVAALPATGAQAQPAAGCQWAATDLPLPAGFTNGAVSGSDGGDRFAGVVWNQPASRHGVVWENGVPRLLGQVNFTNTYVTDVDPSGTAVGRADNGAGSDAMRHHVGVWQWLQPMYDAHGINDAGHIVGPGTTRGQVVVWRPDQPAARILTLPGDEAVSATGIDDAGRVFASTTQANSYVWSATGVRTQVTPVQPGGWVQVRAITAGRLVGQSGGASGPTVAVEWDASGQVVRTLPDGADARSVNANTLVLGKLTSGAAGVWDDGVFTGALTKPAGAASVNTGSVTDAGVVGGAYTLTGTGRSVPARWTC